MTWVGIVDFGDTGNEAEALRQVLEYFGYGVIMYLIGRPNDFIDILSGKNRLSQIKYLVISSHGDQSGFKMPELAASVYLPNEPKGDFNATLIQKYASFYGEVVLASGCCLGNEEMKKAFIGRGVKEFIAPKDYVDGNEWLVFLIGWFYEILSKK